MAPIYANGSKIKQFSVKFCVKTSWLSIYLIYNLLSRFYVRVYDEKSLTHKNAFHFDFLLSFPQQTRVSRHACHFQVELFARKKMIQTINSSCFFYIIYVFFRTITSSSLTRALHDTFDPVSRSAERRQAHQATPKTIRSILMVDFACLALKSDSNSRKTRIWTFRHRLRFPEFLFIFASAEINHNFLHKRLRFIGNSRSTSAASLT